MMWSSDQDLLQHWEQVLMRSGWLAKSPNGWPSRLEWFPTFRNVFPAKIQDLLQHWEQVLPMLDGWLAKRIRYLTKVSLVQLGMLVWLLE